MKEKPFPWKCPSCRKKAVVSVVEDYRTRIEHDGRPYDLIVPALHVFACGECGNRDLDDDANKQVSDALRKAAGLLTPEEIRDGRHGLQMTQKALAEQLDIAEATLSRWETGAQIQQRAFDRLLRAYFEIPELRTFFAEEKANSLLPV
jgi:putative zinc finger/helix-turn-helix YgiT family protein